MITAVGSGEDRYRQGEFKAALEASEFALEEGAGDLSAIRLKARSLIGLRRFGEARAAAIIVLKQNSNDVDALKTFAFASIHIGAVSPAKNSVSLLRRIAPNDPQVYILSAIISESLGAKKKLAEDLRWAVKLDPNRFTGLQSISQSGEKIFIPTDPLSHLLLEGLVEKNKSGFPLQFIGLGLFAICCVGALFHFINPAFESSSVIPEPSPVSAGTTIISGEFKNPYEQKPLEKLLANRYRLDYPIGRGGMGIVWEGIDRGAGDRKIAVKEMSAVVGERRTQMRTLYLKEAKLLEELKHPNIVRLYETLDLPDGVHLIFEFVSGKTLQQLLAERKRLPWTEIKPILIPTAEGLSYAHGKGLVHRDLKPANIMVAENGTIRLMDFGVARNYSDQVNPNEANPIIGQSGPAGLPTHRTTTLAGTPAYRCPESVKGVVSERTDIFSLGVCLYEALAGELPYSHTGWSAKSPRPASIASFGVSLPAGLGELVAAMLRLDHRKRLDSMQTFINRASVI